MADSLALEIVTPEGLKLNTQVAELTAPSVDGEFGVLPGHRPMLAALKTGIVRFKAARGSDLRGEPAGETAVAVGPGFVEIYSDRAVLLTQSFCEKKDVDPVRVRLDLKHADEALDRFSGDPTSAEYGELVAKELWAAAQLELYGDPPPATIRTDYKLTAVDSIEDKEDDPQSS
jgi:F-type H+-transporting ATPase subunit epsilon